jgi:hypothetical protein
MDRTQYFRNQARQCRDAARGNDNRGDRHGLEQLARHYDREAARLAQATAQPAVGQRHSARI